VNIVTIFERAEDVHLNKDVGQILYYLRKYNDGSAELWTFNEIISMLYAHGCQLKLKLLGQLQSNSNLLFNSSLKRTQRFLQWLILSAKSLTPEN
jgi:hypothetical protein